jgi:hypothetical protein
MTEFDTIPLGGDRTGVCGMLADAKPKVLKGMLGRSNEIGKEIYAISYMGEYGIEIEENREGQEESIDLEDAADALRESDAGENEDVYIIHTHPNDTIGLSIADLISIIQLHDKVDERFKGIYAIYRNNIFDGDARISGATIKDGVDKEQFAIVSNIKMISVGLEPDGSEGPDDVIDKFKRAYDEGSLVLNYCDVKLD